MGKAELSKMDPFEMVLLFMMAELAAIPIESLDIPLLNGVAAIVTLLFLEVTISFISIKSTKINNFLKGKPSILINRGKINDKELKNQRISIGDLMEQLRLKNFPSLADVDYAVLEANGDLSIIPKPDKSPLTPADMKIPTSTKVMPMVLISDGYLYQSSLEALGKEEGYLKKELSKAKITDYSQVFLCFFDENSQLHVYPKGDKADELKKEVAIK
jgi:Predicted membrane protein